MANKKKKNISPLVKAKRRQRKKKLRADYRAGGRVSKQYGGGFSGADIDIPTNIDVKLTPAQQKELDKLTSATNTSKAEKERLALIQKQLEADKAAADAKAKKAADAQAAEEDKPWWAIKGYDSLQAAIDSGIYDADGNKIKDTYVDPDDPFDPDEPQPTVDDEDVLPDEPPVTTVRQWWEDNYASLEAATTSGDYELNEDGTIKFDADGDPVPISDAVDEVDEVAEVDKIGPEIGDQYTDPETGEIWVWDGTKYVTYDEYYDIDGEGDEEYDIGYQNPDDGLIYGGLDTEGNPIWKRPDGVSEDATWDGTEWIEPTDDTGVVWNDGDQNPDTGLIYGGLDTEGNEIWKRPDGISDDATWDGTSWVEPSEWTVGQQNPATGLIYTVDGEWIRPDGVSDDATWNSETGEWEEPTDETGWWSEYFYPSEQAAIDSGNFELDENDEYVATAEYLYEVSQPGYTTFTQWEEEFAVQIGPIYDTLSDSDKFAMYQLYLRAINLGTNLAGGGFDVKTYTDLDKEARLARLSATIEAARQGMIIDEEGNEIDLSIPDPVKAGGYVLDEEGKPVIDPVTGKPTLAVADQDVAAGMIIEEDAEGNRFVREATAAEAGGFLMNAAGDDYERYPPGHEKAGQPIPAISEEEVTTIDEDTDLETADITGYQRDSEGKLILGDDGKPMPITATPYTAAQVPNFLRKEDGSLELDGNGDPIPVGVVEAATSSITLDADGNPDDDAIAELTATALDLSSTVTGATVELSEDEKETQATVTGTISAESKVDTITKVAGTTLPRVLRAKKQLRRAGLSEADIDAFANDPELLEEKLLEYTEAERGMIAGLPEEALVNVQLAALLDGMEAGDIPVFARPAVAAVNQMMAARGLTASTVGRDNLFNAIITAAVPIAQQNAQSIKESVLQQRGIEAQAEQVNAQMEQQRAISNADKSFQMDMAEFSSEVQKEVNNSKFFQTVALTESSHAQQAAIQEALNQTQLDIAVLNTTERLAVRNADAFLKMDLANLNNEQQANVVNAQMEQQRLLSNQAADNAAKQFNAQSENQMTQFMTNLAAQTDQFNVTQQNAMSQFNATQENAAEARRVGREADLAKFNAQLVTQTDQFNIQQDYQRVQWNAQNSAAVEQSNTQWRRQTNLADTAAQNAVNMQNAQNSFQLSTQALAFMWQELRDQADFDFRKAENFENRRVQIIATAMANESDVWEVYDDYLTTLLSSITNAYGTEYSPDVGIGDG